MELFDTIVLCADLVGIFVIITLTLIFVFSTPRPFVEQINVNFLRLLWVAGLLLTANYFVIKNTLFLLQVDGSLE
tara:strand:- start:5346 stop:5570 length:225 start_codon:yes stop_codon:yes gene_type:complete